MKFSLPLAVAGVLVTGTLAGTAYAGNLDENREANALQAAKVSLTRAIATAEQRTGGRAYDAGVDLKGNETHIGVETNGPTGVQTVIVDTQSGQVVGAHAGGEAD